MKNLLFILFCIPLFAQVPNTNTFTMRDVCDEIGVSYSGRTLTELFGLATGTFDPAYVGSKNSLYNFRNYSHVSGLRYEGINLVLPNNGTGFFMSSDGQWIAYSITVSNKAIKVSKLGTPFNISSVTNTYTYNTDLTVHDIHFSYNGMHMYSTSLGSQVIHKEMTQSPFRPDLGEVFIDQTPVSSYPSGIFMNSNGTRYIWQSYQGGIHYLKTTTLSTAYNISTGGTVSNLINVPSSAYGVYGKYHYFAKAVNQGQGVEITQYISDSPYNHDGINIANPESVKLIQNMPPISSIYGVNTIYPSPNGKFLYLWAVGANDVIPRIYQITMTGTNIL